MHELDFARIRHEHPEMNEPVIRFLVDEIRVMNERLLEASTLGRAAGAAPGARALAGVRRRDRAGGDPADPGDARRDGRHLQGTVNAVLRDAQSRGLVELSRGATRVVDSVGLAKRAR